MAGQQRASAGMPTVVRNAKIALLDIDLRKTKMAFGVQVLVSDPSKLEDIRKRWERSLCSLLWDECAMCVRVCVSTARAISPRSALKC